MIANDVNKGFNCMANVKYFIPGYIHYDKNGKNLCIESELLKNKIRITDPLLQEEFYVIQNHGCHELNTPFKKFLYQQEMLLSKEEIEEALLRAKQLMKEIFFATIFITEKCNFRCKYCFQSHISITMNHRTLKKIIHYIEHQAQSHKIIHISWFGGEPTLCQDSIVQASSYIKLQQNQYHFKYEASMTTNGYLLNVDSFVNLYNAGITHYQITLDGWNHDKTRIHISGKPTLQTILHNLIGISNLPKEKYIFQITLRRNILDDDEDFEWYNYIHKTFGADDRFMISVIPVHDWGGQSVHELNLIPSDNVNQTVATHLNYIDEIGMARKKPTRDLFSGVCKASYPDSFVFRANGKIEKCSRCLDHTKNHLGHVDPEKGVLLNEEINKIWTSSHLKQECLRCTEVLRCFNMVCRKANIIDKTDPCYYQYLKSN